MWYNLKPSEYAEWLRFCAERSREHARRHEADNKPWSPYEAKRAAWTARRLEAMALLCDVATAPRAGGVDFRGLNDPITPDVIRRRRITLIEREARS